MEIFRKVDNVRIGLLDCKINYGLSWEIKNIDSEIFSDNLDFYTPFR